MAPILYNVRELTNQHLPGVTSPRVVTMNAVLKTGDGRSSLTTWTLAAAAPSLEFDSARAGADLMHDPLQHGLDRRRNAPGPTLSVEEFSCCVI